MQIALMERLIIIRLNKNFKQTETTTFFNELL